MNKLKKMIKVNFETYYKSNLTFLDIFPKTKSNKIANKYKCLKNRFVTLTLMLCFLSITFLILSFYFVEPVNVIFINNFVSLISEEDQNYMNNYVDYIDTDCSIYLSVSETIDFYIYKGFNCNQDKLEIIYFYKFDFKCQNTETVDLLVIINSVSTEFTITHINRIGVFLTNDLELESSNKVPILISEKEKVYQFTLNL